MTPTGRSLVQRAFDAVNRAMPRSGEDTMRLATKGWEKLSGTEKPAEKAKPIKVSVPISR
jgi:hypothetical protein